MIGHKDAVAKLNALIEKASSLTSVPEKLKIYRDLIDGLKNAAWLLQMPRSEDEPLILALTALLDLAMQKKSDPKPWWVKDYSLFCWCMDRIEQRIGHPKDRNT